MENLRGCGIVQDNEESVKATERASVQLIIPRAGRRSREGSFSFQAHSLLLIECS